MIIVKLTGTVELLSGLHIGGGDDTMKIGGIDNQVIKDANTDNPYIPGSSLKGKMRSLLEWDAGVVGIGDGNPFNSKLLNDAIFSDEKIKRNAETLLKLFGDKEGAFGITRISVGDCRLSESSKDMILSEAKYENVINRQKGTAEHPRQTERVPAGVKFDFDIRIKVLDENDSEEELVSMIKKGFELIESDYLGGSGSRGYGRVKFHLSE
jgi:CRISPR-associated protein Csm3